MAHPNPNPNPNPNPSSSPSPLPPDGFSLESDDMSTFLQSLLQTSTIPSSSASQYHHQLQSEEIRRQFYEPVTFPDSSSGLDFSFRADSYAPEDTDRSRSAFSGAIASSAEEIGDFDCEIEDASDVQRSSGPCRNSNSNSSSKRTRGAEFHNISEKRRRQRINEKMKALQKLIPNSNKTDKASMLDEAIEYLKQLQLQVQMLALRNGSTLQPFYIPGVMHSAQPTSAGLYYNMAEGLPSSSRGAGSLTAQQELPVQTIYNASGRCASSEQKLFLPSSLNLGNSESSFALEPSSSTHCRPFNHATPSKELYSGTKLSQLQMDMGHCGDESSSGVSS